jgi:hypothetical protein
MWQKGMDANVKNVVKFATPVHWKHKPHKNVPYKLSLEYKHISFYDPLVSDHLSCSQDQRVTKEIMTNKVNEFLPAVFPHYILTRRMAPDNFQNINTPAQRELSMTALCPQTNISEAYVKSKGDQDVN